MLVKDVGGNFKFTQASRTISAVDLRRYLKTFSPLLGRNYRFVKLIHYRKFLSINYDQPEVGNG